MAEATYTLGRLRAPSRLRPHLVGELAVVAALLVFYDMVREHAAPRRAAALAHGQDVLDAEKSLHLDWEAATNQWLNSHLAIRQLSSWYYQLAHLTVAMSVLAWCYLAAPTVYRTARNVLVATNVVGLIVFALCPVAPPRLLPNASFTDTVAVTLGEGPAGHPAPDQYAAMPSLHLAWATWVALTVWLVTAERGGWRWLRVPAVAHPALTSAAVVSTANHYVLDIVAGVALALLAWVVVVRLMASSHGQMMARRISTANTQPAGTRGSQTVISR